MPGLGSNSLFVVYVKWPWEVTASSEDCHRFGFFYESLITKVTMFVSYSEEHWHVT
jgi:hypothetical protein